MTRVPVLKGTVPHEQSAKFGGAEVFIKPASTGTGVVAGGAMRAVLESVGVTDVLAKSKGSSNPHNLVKATIFSFGRDERCPYGCSEQRRKYGKKYLEDKGGIMSTIKIKQVKSRNWCSC